ncbi:hypothetical protein BO71DRAFT_394010 [Aspergillus ellipticus CBS 707.79]|uniref:Uncharacterized protein n=1 Tax=Aspergillus ellipticus CBS 707.79 TaxID=1448320 RepID=A0A319DU31_9EURO|nr:hypothetical protein BO71DRAFT_394010 [Aspergillus ellipticus CBS 707.79]
MLSGLENGLVGWDSEYDPENPSCLLFAVFVPISFLWYGWAADKHVHWIVPIIGLMPFGFGMMGIFAPIQTYFIDACGPYAASCPSPA